MMTSQQPRELANLPSREQPGAAQAAIAESLELMKRIATGGVTCFGCGAVATAIKGDKPVCGNCRDLNTTELRIARLRLKGL